MVTAALILVAGSTFSFVDPPPYTFDVGSDGFTCIRAYEKRKLDVTTAAGTTSGNHAFVLEIANDGNQPVAAVDGLPYDSVGPTIELVAISSGGFVDTSGTLVTSGLPSGFSGGTALQVGTSVVAKAAFVATGGTFQVTPIPGFKIFAGTRTEYTKDNVVRYAFRGGVCEYKLNILPCTADASIDTRKVFGQPNAEGKAEIFDPNSSGEYVRFGTWSRNGGLFVGSVRRPNTYKDRSGLGRIQLQVRPYSIPSGALRAVVASVFCVGVAPQFKHPITLYADCPITVGTETEAEMSWGNKWTLEAPSATTGYEEFLNTQTISRTDTNSNVWQYMSAQVNMNNYLSQQIGQVAPTSRHLSAVIKLADEPDDPSDDSPNAWWYFASREYVGQNLGVTNPTHADRLPDAHPRFFVLEQIQ